MARRWSQLRIPPWIGLAFIVRSFLAFPRTTTTPPGKRSRKWRRVTTKSKSCSSLERRTISFSPLGNVSWCFLRHTSPIPIARVRAHLIVYFINILIRSRWTLRIKARRLRRHVNERRRPSSRLSSRLIRRMPHTFPRRSPPVSIRWPCRWSNGNVCRWLVRRSSAFLRVRRREPFCHRISSLIWTPRRRWAPLWCNANIFSIPCEPLSRNNFSPRRGAAKNRRESALKWPHHPARIRRPRRRPRRRNPRTSNVWNRPRRPRCQPSIRKALAKQQNRSPSQAKALLKGLFSSAGVVPSLSLPHAVCVCVCVCIYFSCYFLSPCTSRKIEPWREFDWHRLLDEQSV